MRTLNEEFETKTENILIYQLVDFKRFPFDLHFEDI